ncbi:unnamed protein product [Cunninghamella echinulata]
MSNLPSHLEFNSNNRSEIIHAKGIWKVYPNLHRLDNIDLRDTNGNLKSDSYWTVTHMQAFHIIPILDLEIKDVLPIEFMMNDDKLTDSFYLFWKLNRDDLYDNNWDNFYTSTKNIRPKNTAAITTCLGNLMALLECRRSKGSDLPSLSGKGEKLEVETQAFAGSLCRAFLNILELHKKYHPSWDYVNSSAKYVYRYAKNDGAIVHIDDNKQTLSFVWIEMKPLEYAPRPDTQNAYRSTIPQKAAEALSFTQSHWENIGVNIKDQETFGIEFNHRYASFWHALFPSEYLLDAFYQPVLHYNHAIALKRTKVFDLVEPNDRKEFSRCLAGLLNYISRGNPLIGLY